MENSKQYLTVEEVASIYEVTPQYIRKLINTGKLQAEQFGKSWAIPAEVANNPDNLFQFKKNINDQIRKSSDVPSIVALSFFSGAMGLDLGLESEGFHFLLASEINENARKTILYNRPDIGLIGDINKYTASDIRKFANISEDVDVDLMVGGPPCQAFSTAGKREAFNDERGNVFLTYLDRILSIRPKIAVIENVRGLLSAPYKYEFPSDKKFGLPEKTPDELKGGALLEIIKTLENGGYTISFNLYNAANFGSPQKRERVVMICTRNGVRAPYLTPTNSENGEYGLPRWNILKNVLSDMPEEEQEYIPFPERRLKFYRVLKEGQFWKDLPYELQVEAMGKKLELGGGKTGFYRRLSFDKPSPTLVTDPTMPATDLCHPTLDRPLSVQEYKRIQEFPDDWVIWGNTKDKYKQIGNAVPISLGKAIGRLVKGLLSGEYENNDLKFKDFKYSRYSNTDDISFKELMNSKHNEEKNRKKKEKKEEKDIQLTLF